MSARKRAYRPYLTIALIAAGLIAVLAAVPVELPTFISSQGIVFPAREWTLSRGDDGRLIAVLRDNVNGTVDAVDVVVFERGDMVRVTASDLVRDGAAVDSGATVAVVKSFRALTELTERKGVHEAERAALSVYASGQKESEIRAAELAVERARESVRFERTQVERLMELVERGMAAELELESAHNRLRDAELRLDERRANLRSLLSGAKEEEVAWRRARLRSAEDELSLAGQRFADSLIVAPFRGRLSGGIEAETFVRLLSSESWAVRFSIPWSRRAEVPPGTAAVVIDGERRIPATIHRIGDRVITIRDTPYLEAIAVTDSATDLAEGLRVAVSIPTGSRRLLGYIYATVTE
jgi:hypothetical protein